MPVNLSKSKQKRFWDKWRASGAVSNPLLSMTLSELGFESGIILGVVRREFREELDDLSIFSKPPFFPKDETGIKRLMKEVRESLLKTPEHLCQVTVGVILYSWCQKHQGFVNMKDRVMRNFYLKEMRRLFDNLLKLGYPRKRLDAIPSSNIIFGIRSWEEFETDMGRRCEEEFSMMEERRSSGLLYSIHL